MSIVNRRNAVLGWGVWQVGKVAAKRKAKQAMEPKDRGRSVGKIVPAVAAAGGALWFWRRRRSENKPTK
jgi:MYXO-CTERM domain-containing protein